MRLLVLGGTRFVGRAIVSIAVATGWEVTTFNRGISSEDVEGVQAIRGDRTNRREVARLAAAGPWDATVDTTAFVPRNALEVAQALTPRSRLYTLVSTVSVYRDWPRAPLSEDSEVLPCPPDADETFGHDEEDGPTQYGYQKSGCEAAVLETFGAERSIILRPGVVLGPGEYVGRLPWWLNRIAAGGKVIAPAPAARSIQPIDVRDLAEFAIHTVAEGMHGVYNVTGRGDFTFGDLLDACRRTTHSAAELVWIPPETLLEHDVRQWSELPLWRTYEGTWQVDSAKARNAGLQVRSLDETVQDTWEWMGRESITQNERSDEIGLPSAKEKTLLDADAYGRTQSYLSLALIRCPGTRNAKLGLVCSFTQSGDSC